MSNDEFAVPSSFVIRTSSFGQDRGSLHGIVIAGEAHKMDLPLVSVIMPVRNEGPYVDVSLSAVLTQDYPAERMEIIVADGMSTDQTRGIVRWLAWGYPNLRMIDNPGRIAPSGLNAATAQASGEIIIRVDGHAEIAPDYVRRCVTHLQEDGVDGLGGDRNRGPIGHRTGDRAGHEFQVRRGEFGLPHRPRSVDAGRYGPLPRLQARRDRARRPVRRRTGAQPG
jgi:cellulose synthase/poly-beta-1,6-N-acetylglucosamine synthase-like glycosyltransferase